MTVSSKTLFLLKKYGVLLTFFIPLLAFALKCDICNKRIRGNYIKSETQNFCSKQCLHSILPKCFTCKKPCETSSVQMMEKTFCSRKCMHLHYKCNLCRRGLDKVIIVKTPLNEIFLYCNDCSRRKTCYFCALPCIPVQEVKDRTLCKKCFSSAVRNEQDIRNLFNIIRKDLAKFYAFDAVHKIELKIVSADKLASISKTNYTPENAKRLALMQYQQHYVEKKKFRRTEKKVTKEICTIYLLSATPKPLLADAIVHELTHDHIRHNVGKTNDLASEEGFCELVAYLYNIKINNKRTNRMKEINTDPVYGGGFKKMRSIYNRTKSLKQTMKYVK